ncbi:MAG TPA: hypothetical protein VNA27_07770 [Rubrobacteraceae bacterium]|nr:hypothetical protein [Rubrobacteraceae bacterium]
MTTLRDLKSFGESGTLVYLADCVELMRLMPAGCVDVIFADPLYRLSGGVTVKSGRVAPVDKGNWDRSTGNKPLVALTADAPPLELMTSQGLWQEQARQID